MDDEEHLYPRVSLSEFVVAIRRYRTRDVLVATNAVCRNLGGAQKRPFQLERAVVRSGRRYVETLHFGDHTLAFIAKQSILQCSIFRNSELTDDDYANLINLHGLLDDAFITNTNDSPLAPYAFFLRLAWEQFTFQDPVGNLIPRYLTIFTTMNELDDRRVVDVPMEFREQTGLRIEEFMSLGVAAWTLASHNALFRADALTSTEVRTIAEKASGGRLERFLDLTAADYDRFRAESARFALTPLLAKTEFNALHTYPLIRTGHGELVAPVPSLVLARATRGIYYILQDAFQRADGNPFKEQFGRDFERYVGFLLEGAYGADRVIHEPVYGKEHRHGADWLVRDGRKMIVIECTASALTVEAKTAAEFEKVVKDVGRMYADRIAKLGDKIDALRSGIAGIDCSDVEEFVPVIVTHEALYVEPAIKAFVREALQGHDEMFSAVHLIDISDVEAVTARPAVSMSELLAEWREAYKADGQSFGVFLHNKAKRGGSDERHPYLRDVFNEFQRQLLPQALGGETLEQA